MARAFDGLDWLDTLSVRRPLFLDESREEGSGFFQLETRRNNDVCVL
jgi:hypothetical protein